MCDRTLPSLLVFNVESNDHNVWKSRKEDKFRFSEVIDSEIWNQNKFSSYLIQYIFKVKYTDDKIKVEEEYQEIVFFQILTNMYTQLTQLPWLPLHKTDKSKMFYDHSYESVVIPRLTIRIAQYWYWLGVKYRIYHFNPYSQKRAVGQIALQRTQLAQAPQLLATQQKQLRKEIKGCCGF